MRILFAHPLVEAVTGWDFADGAWLGAPSGLIRRDNTVKPAYKALDRLIHEEWETNVSATTDTQGHLEFEGYRGVYEAEYEGRTAEFEVRKGMEPVTVSF